MYKIDIWIAKKLIQLSAFLIKRYIKPTNDKKFRSDVAIGDGNNPEIVMPKNVSDIMGNYYKKYKGSGKPDIKMGDINIIREARCLEPVIGIKDKIFTKNELMKMFDIPEKHIIDLDKKAKLTLGTKAAAGTHLYKSSYVV